MEAIKEAAPSVWAYIYDEGRPTGCSRCPYAVEHDIDNPYRDRANPSDPDEGWYDCKLLGNGKYWGETPGCTEQQWKESAQKQLIENLDLTLRHKCDVEAAKALFGRFWAAIWDDQNLQKTGKEIRTEIMKDVSPRVRYQFERLLENGVIPNEQQSENPVHD